MYGTHPTLLINDWSHSGQRLNENISVGETYENEKWRVHRYASSLVITDLENAGKRGKKVRVISLYNLDYRQAQAPGVIATMMELIRKNAHLGRVWHAAEKQAELTGVSLDDQEVRGVDTMPAGFKPIRIDGEHVEIEASYDAFNVNDKADQNNLPACIPSARGGKKMIPLFYRWVKDNEQKLKSMKFHEILKGMEQQGVTYHYYCRMD